MKKFLEKFIEYGLYLFVFLLPWQTTLILRSPTLNGQIWEYGKINLYAVDLLLATIMLGWLVLRLIFYRGQKINKLDFKKMPIYLISLLFIFWSGVSVFWSADKELAFYWLIKLTEALALFWLILNLNFNLNYFGLSLIAGGLIQAFLGSWQFINQTTFSFKWLGLTYHDMAEAGTSVVETSLRRWLRSYGALPHPNILGGLLMASEILVIFYYLKLYRKLEKIWDNSDATEKKNKDTKKIVWLILSALFVFIIILAGLIFSFSRNAWLGFALSFIIFSLYFLKQKKWFDLFNLFKLGLIAGLIFASLFLIYQEPFLSRLTTNQKLEKQSFEERTTYLKQSENLREKHWLYGVGIGNYTLAVYNEINNHYSGKFYQPVHNVYLLIWSELGIVGLVLFLLFIFYCLFFSLAKKVKNNFLFLTYLTIFISFLIMMFFDHWLWSSNFGLLFFWLILALLLKTKTK